MPRSGPRPHTWKVQGDIPHQQHCAWLKMKAQAQFRGEPFMLTLEEYQLLWMGMWHRKGRGSDDYCLTREDPEGAWVVGNVYCIPRVEHLRRQRLYKKMKNQELKSWHDVTNKS